MHQIYRSTFPFRSPRQSCSYRLTHCGQAPIAWADLGRLSNCFPGQSVNFSNRATITKKRPAFLLRLLDLTLVVFLTSAGQESPIQLRADKKRGSAHRWLTRPTFTAAGPQLALLEPGQFNKALASGLIQPWPDAWLDVSYAHQVFDDLMELLDESALPTN